jgi:hypothetical protein
MASAGVVVGPELGVCCWAGVGGERTLAWYVVLTVAAQAPSTC